jgi:ribosomal protein S11
MRVNKFFYFLTKELAFYGITVVNFRIRRPVAFNGVRRRKLRRL